MNIMNLLVDFFGRTFERFGLSPIPGRIFGVLVSREDSVSLQELCDTLDISKAAVSMHVRKLESLGYCVRVPVRGSKAHSYTASQDFIGSSFRGRMAAEREYLLELRALAQNEDGEPASRRIRDLIVFQEIMLEKQAEALAEFALRRQGS